jgi:hypothetical protein
VSALRTFRIVRGDNPESGNYGIEYTLDSARDAAHLLAAEHEDWFEVIDDDCRQVAVVEWFPSAVPA